MASALRKHHQVKCKRVPLLSNIPLQHQVLAAFGFRMEVGYTTLGTVGSFFMCKSLKSAS